MFKKDEIDIGDLSRSDRYMMRRTVEFSPSDGLLMTH